MSKSPCELVALIVLGLAALPALAQETPAAEDAAASRPGQFGLGREALPEEIEAWDVKVMPDGRGLRPGSGSVEAGEELFITYCAACHGDFAEGLDNWPSLAGGFDTLDQDDPEKTVGSFWPYLSTVWDYVHRSMPFGQAQILTPDETYAITAYILYSNMLVEDDFVLSNENFGEVQLPNAEGFFEDDRETVEYPRFSQEPCMENCKTKVEITRRASILDVTPEDSTDGPSGVVE
jgi:cytochrome c